MRTIHHVVRKALGSALLAAAAALRENETVAIVLFYKLPAKVRFFSICTAIKRNMITIF
jgi:hypothetical protein